MRWSFWAFQFFVNPLHQTSASIYNKYRWRIYVNYSEKPCCYDSILKIKSIKKWLQSERSLQRENFHRGKVSHGEMSEISGCRSLSLLLILATISLQFIPGWASNIFIKFLMIQLYHSLPFFVSCISIISMEI